MAYMSPWDALYADSTWGTDNYKYQQDDRAVFNIDWDDCDITVDITRVIVESRPEEDYFKAEEEKVFRGSVKYIDNKEVNNLMRDLINVGRYKRMKRIVEECFASGVIEKNYDDYYPMFKKLIEDKFEKFESVLDEDVKLILEVADEER